MSICDNLRTIFPKYTQTSEGQTEVKVLEKGSQAKLIEVKWTNSNFQVIDPRIVSNMKSLFESGGSVKMLHLDCDGIMIFEKDGQKYLFFSELKSGFDPRRINKAKNQIIASYLKINMILNLLSDYEKADYIIKGFIFSNPPTGTDLRDLSKITMLGTTSRYLTEPFFVYDLCFEQNPFLLQSSSLYELRNVPLDLDKGLFDKIEFYHIPVPNGQTSITLDVQNYI